MKQKKKMESAKRCVVKRRKGRRGKGKQYLACSLILVLCIMMIGTTGLIENSHSQQAQAYVADDDVWDWYDISDDEGDGDEAENDGPEESFSEDTDTSDTGDEIWNENEEEDELVSESASESESETESESESESESETESESESESEPETESESESKSEPETELESESEESEGEPESGSENGDEGETAIEPESEWKEEQEPGSEQETEIATESQTERESESEDASERESGSESEDASEREPESEAEEESESEALQETELLPEPETELEPETDHVREEIRRGEHYEIEGDPGAWYRDEQDRLWVRSGTNLYVRVTGAADYSEGAGKQDLKEDGRIVFSLKKIDANGKVLKESAISGEAYYVDGEAPQAEISTSGISEDGTVYAAQQADVTLMISPDGKSGMKSAAYTVLTCGEDGKLQGSPETASWTPCRNGDEIALREEGMFRVFVRTEDQVGNLAFAQSSPICIDRRPPEVVIEGVGDQTANSGEVKIRVAVKDAHYRTGSMKATLAGVNTGKTAAVNTREESQKGGTLEYLNFPRQKEYDDVYRLHVQAEDIAGNRSEKDMEFSVNRFGSVYDLDASTRTNLKQYFLSKAEDVTFFETNIDYVGESSIFCRRDGTLKELKRGVDYQVTMQGSKDSWKQYRYTVPAEYFSREGVYELLLSSEDAAENRGDTGMQEKQVVFALDWTAPGCTLTGIEQQVYKAENLTARLTPYDNIELRTVRIYHDSELLQEKKEGELSDKTIEIPLSASKDWQTLQVYLCDMAGNEYWTEEMPVYLSKQTKQVPEYVKTRPSAREKLLGKTKAGEQLSDEAAEQSRKTETRAAQLGSPSAGGRKTVQGRRKEGIILLLLGLFMFVITVAACAMTRIRKK